MRWKRWSGSTYKVLLTLTKSVIVEDAEFYASLQMNLPKMTEIHRLSQQAAKTWADIVKSKDRLEKADPDFKRAYKNMYKFLEK